MGTRVNIIKDINLNKIRSALREAGTATKPRLAEITGLSVVTVNSLVNTLTETGEILPDEILNSESGRPAASFRYHGEFRLALVIYMHEYHSRDTAFYCVVNLRGEVLERDIQVLTDVNVESFDSRIEKLLRKFPQIKAICFGIPGCEVNQKLIISDYKLMREQSLSGYIGGKFLLPVLVENDINAAILGYCHRNAVKEGETVIGIYFPDKYPPGAGIYVNGNIYKGRNGLAGEIVKLPLGIDWETFDYSPKEVEELVLKTVQVFLCMFNPDRIVLYGEKLNRELITKIHKRFASPVEQIMLPEIMISSELNTDFEAGIKQVAFDMIDTVGWSGSLS
jgi:predicted NBD/HSP70 family sugar kinase